MYLNTHSHVRTLSSALKRTRNIRLEQVCGKWKVFKSSTQMLVQSEKILCQMFVTYKTDATTRNEPPLSFLRWTLTLFSSTLKRSATRYMVCPTRLTLSSVCTISIHRRENTLRNVSRYEKQMHDVPQWQYDPSPKNLQYTTVPFYALNDWFLLFQ